MITTFEERDTSIASAAKQLEEEYVAKVQGKDARIKAMANLYCVEIVKKDDKCRHLTAKLHQNRKTSSTNDFFLLVLPIRYCITRWKRSMKIIEMCYSAVAQLQALSSWWRTK